MIEPPTRASAGKAPRRDVSDGVGADDDVAVNAGEDSTRRGGVGERRGEDAGDRE